MAADTAAGEPERSRRLERGIWFVTGLVYGALAVWLVATHPG